MAYNQDAPNAVLCPLVDEMIDDIDCIENRECIDGMIILSSLPDKYKQKSDYQKICKSCKWHNY